MKMKIEVVTIIDPNLKDTNSSNVSEALSELSVKNE